MSYRDAERRFQRRHGDELMHRLALPGDEPTNWGAIAVLLAIFAAIAWLGWTQ